jgi:alanine racemase
MLHQAPAKKAGNKATISISMAENTVNREADELMRTVARIDLSALAHNYGAIKSMVPQHTVLLCVIKANAYGHGAVEVGRHLERIGADYLAVATVQEARELRNSGISLPVLVLSGILPWDSIEEFAHDNLTPVISSLEMIESLKGVSLPVSGLRVHIKVDTGMGRLGFSIQDIALVAERLQMIDNIDVEGVMSHFPSSDIRDEFGMSQIEEFMKVVKFLSSKGIKPRYVHMANSGAICNYPEAHFSMVRPGIMLYGSYPDPLLRMKVPLKPVMTWISHVAFIRTIPADSPVSYGRTYTTTRETKVAYIPIGYADGYPMGLSNRGMVVVKGAGCPVLGRVCMEWIMADITDVNGVIPTDEVILMGASGHGESVSADDIAEETGSIPYDILCGISCRVPRLYDE